MKLHSPIRRPYRVPRSAVAFTPKGGCPLKQPCYPRPKVVTHFGVAFTPKGRCPLKRAPGYPSPAHTLSGSIHPQGWVPVETSGWFAPSGVPPASGSIHPQGWVPVETRARTLSYCAGAPGALRSIHPQGWVPVETLFASSTYRSIAVAFTPKGGCPLKHEQLNVHDVAPGVAFTPKGGCG